MITQEHLWPEYSPFCLDLDYYRRVSALLGLKDQWWRGLLGVVCLPHFTPEWSLRLFEKES